MRENLPVYVDPTVFLSLVVWCLIVLCGVCGLCYYCCKVAAPPERLAAQGLFVHHPSLVYFDRSARQGFSTSRTLRFLCIYKELLAFSERPLLPITPHAFFRSSSCWSILGVALNMHWLHLCCNVNVAVFPLLVSRLLLPLSVLCVSRVARPDASSARLCPLSLPLPPASRVFFIFSCNRLTRKRSCTP